MTSPSIVDRLVSCKGCGTPLKLPQRSGELHCKVCDSHFHYIPELRYCSYFNFLDVKGEDYQMMINSDITIGTNERKIVTVFDTLIRSITKTIPIRSAWVSEKHSKITTQETYEIIQEGNQQQIVFKTACFLDDLNSVNGTSVNGVHVNDTVELKHGDVIVLAPGCKRYVEIHYFEKRER